ncbi:MAG: glycoside hydrolase family 9 protein, partial [Planctomycetes bacterium]|nr:glycoside hydrolase family 9 protein [Planctomycetota bacterium]
MRITNILSVGVLCLAVCQYVAATEITHVGLADRNLLMLEILDGEAVQGEDGGMGSIKHVNYTSAALQQASYVLKSADGSSMAIKSVGHKSLGNEFVKSGGWAWTWQTRHSLYLQLSTELVDGATYTLETGKAFGKKLETTFTANSQKLMSLSIHVSEIGFIPKGPKRGFLSAWAGSAGDVDFSHYAGKDFFIYTDKGSEAFKGTINKRRGKTEKGDDAYGSNYQKADVYEMDFSSLEKDGSYVLSIPGLGSSVPFTISSSSYQQAYQVALKGLYYQRCGVAQPAEFAGETWKRQRCHHPKDGKTVLASNLRLMDGSMGFGKMDVFKELPKQATKTKLPNYWGGWHDAGDYDRRIQHLNNAAQLLDVYSIFPKHFKDGDVNIPEKGNKIPDIVDEALFCVDFFLRGMTAD